jgi:hypothetical protein
VRFRRSGSEVVLIKHTHDGLYFHGKKLRNSICNACAMYRNVDREGAEKKNETQSFTRSTVTSPSVLMETQTRWLS